MLAYEKDDIQEQYASNKIKRKEVGTRRHCGIYKYKFNYNDSHYFK